MFLVFFTINAKEFAQASESFFKSGFLGLGGFSFGGGFKILPIPFKNEFYHKI